MTESLRSTIQGFARGLRPCLFDLQAFGRIHLFIETPEANLVAGMSWLQNTVTRRYNVRHRAWGRLFGDRYKAIVVDGGDAYHYRTLADYIHLNPVRARLVKPKKGQSVMDYAWSSVAGGWALPPGKRPKWLAAEDGMKRFDLPDTVAGRRRLVERLDRCAVEEDFKKCERGRSRKTRVDGGRWLWLGVG
ncbi:transposase [Haloferula sp.]|uniref:transposase n=1 Tax=Haloferula sp. TaxID=2497595 RepID=UPI00329F4299